MAGGMDVGGGKGKKSLDVAINLVPFIDLMAVTISFLIMTAVWSQIGRLQVSERGAGQETTPARSPVTLTLVIGGKELLLRAGQAAPEALSLSRDSRQRIDLAPLRSRLKQIKDQVPEQTQITLQAEDTVRYEDLVRIIDGC